MIFLTGPLVFTKLSFNTVEGNFIENFFVLKTFKTVNSLTIEPSGGMFRNLRFSFISFHFLGRFFDPGTFETASFTTS